MTQEIEKIISLQPLYEQQGRRYTFKRFLFKKLVREAKQNHLTGISGLRGSGKTVLLLQLLNYFSSSFYISLDTLENIDLFELARELEKRYQIKYLLLDEVHYLPNWHKYLKQIYDVLKVKVFFTSSISLDILGTRADLSRRVNILSLPVMSFREYLLIAHNISHPLLSLDDILNNNQLQADTTLEGIFKEYLNYPLISQLADKTPSLVKNIIERMIDYDLVNIKKLSLTDKINLHQTLKFLSQIEGGDISLTSLAANIGVSKYKMQNYVELLEKAFILYSVLPQGKNVLKEPKILLNLPFRLYLSEKTFSDILGVLKEDFFVTIMKAVDVPVYYLKTQRGRKTPDFYLELKGQRWVVEIGGKKKGFSQFKGVKVENKRVALYPFTPKPLSLPLYLFGMLY